LLCKSNLGASKKVPDSGIARSLHSFDAGIWLVGDKRGPMMLIHESRDDTWADTGRGAAFAYTAGWLTAMRSCGFVT
jgi:hypothetical protein